MSRISFEPLPSTTWFAATPSFSDNFAFSAKPAPSGRDKTSLVMSTKNEPGAVVKLLQPLADAGISMSRLESRPARSGNWEYLFFVVCQGHRQNANLAGALAEIEARAAFLKILGSYPAAS